MKWELEMTDPSEAQQKTFTENLHDMARVQQSMDMTKKVGLLT